jgi:small subunit ribosomal protein S17
MADDESKPEETPVEESSDAAPAGASDEVAEDQAEPAAPSEPEPADTGSEAEDVGGESAEDVGGDIQEEPAAEEAPAEAPAAEEAPEETLSRKQQRKLERSTASGPAGPQRSLEERLSERAEGRRRNAANRSRYRKRQRDKAGEPGTGTPPSDRGAGPKKVRQGKVVSTKADKTITVKIEVARRHPTYEKVVRRSATLHAHDATNQAQEGDTVRVVETRPLSRTKRWRLVEIIERAR